MDSANTDEMTSLTSADRLGRELGWRDGWDVGAASAVDKITAADFPTIAGPSPNVLDPL